MVHQPKKRKSSGESAEFVSLLRTAGDPATKGDQLARLQRHRSRRVRQAVAGNPNLDIENVSTAALGFPESVLHNPVLDWLLLEDANWLEDLDAQARHRLLCSPIISPALLWWAARFGQPADQLSVLTNRAAAVEIVSWIAEQNTEGHSRVAAQHRVLHTTANAAADRDDRDNRDDRDDRDDVGAAAVGHLSGQAVPRSPRLRSTTSSLADKPRESLSPDPLDGQNLAVREELAAQELRALSVQNFSSDAVLLLSCARLPAWIQPVLAGADVETRRMLSKHTDATATSLQTLAFDDEADIRMLIAQRPSLPAATRQLLTLLGQLPTDCLDHEVGPQALEAVTTADPLTPPDVVGQVDQVHPGNTPDNILGDSHHNERRAGDQSDDQLPLDVPAYLASKFERTEQSLAKRWIAAHPLAPESVLQSAVISSDWHVREAAASNPAISFPVAAVSLLDADKDVRIALALNPKCPAAFLPILRADSNESVRIAAEENPLHGETSSPTPTVQTRRLLNKLSKQTPAVRRLLAQLPGQSAAEQRSFARDEQWEVRLACALNPEAEPATLALLVCDPDVDVRKAVAGHQNLSSVSRTALLRDEQPAVREALATYASSENLAQLAVDESISVRAVVASHAETNGSTLERLGEDSDASVREFVAKHPATPLAARIRLAASDEAAVKRAALLWASESHQSPDDQLRVITVLLGNNADDAQTWKRLREGDASLSRAKLHRLAYATDWGTESFIGPNTAPKALSVLATFNDWRLRQAVAKHPHTSQATIALLSKDTDYDVRTSAAEHPLLRPRDRQRLGSDPHFAVRLAIAERPDTPTVVVDAMVFDDTDQVREAVLANPRLSPEAVLIYNGVMFGTFVTQRTLTKLARGNSMVRKIIASHPLCSQSLRSALALDDDWRIREAVAKNAATEAAILNAMASDADRDVRAAVAGNANTPVEKLLSLSGDGDHSVRAAVIANPKLAETQRQACLVSAYRRLLISVLPTERVAALLSPLCSARHLNRRRTWQSPQWIERFVVAGHPLVYPSVLQELAKDAHRAVVTQATHSLDNLSRNPNSDLCSDPTSHSTSILYGTPSDNPRDNPNGNPGPKQ